MKKLITSTIALVLFSLITSQDVSAYPLFFAVGYRGEFTHIDAARGQVAPSRDDLPLNLQAVAASSSGTYYAANYNEGFFSIDPFTGKTERLSWPGAPYDVYAMAFSPSGELYAIVDTVDLYLGKVNVGTGNYSVIGKLSGDSKSILGLDFSPDGVLFGVGEGKLYTINPATAKVTSVGNGEAFLQYADSIAFTPDGALYAVGFEFGSGYPDYKWVFVQVDPLTGKRIGQTHPLSISATGLAFIPEPQGPIHLERVEMVGPEKVWENSTVQYRMVAHYDTGYVRDVTESVVWRIDPAEAGYFDANGLLHVKEYIPEGFTIYGKYSEDGVTLESEMSITYFHHLNVYYVDANAAGSNNSSSWADAYTSLQDALTAASSGAKILVAEGIYRADDGVGITPGIQDITFKLKNGVGIYGGFPAGGGRWEDRAPGVYQTIFKAENSDVVVDGSNTDTTAVLDGITVVGNSIGVNIYQGSPTISNCVLESSIGINCRGYWWGVYSSPVIKGCIIRNGDLGLCFRDCSSPIIRDCTIVGNESWGIFSDYECESIITNCTISGNGGGIHAYYSNVTMHNSILWDNNGSAIELENDSSLNVSYSNVEGGSPQSHILPDCKLIWGQGNIDVDPLFDNGYHLSAFSPCINSGDPDFIPEPNETDIDGEGRIINGRIDIGSDEFNSEKPIIKTFPSLIEMYAYEEGANPTPAVFSIQNGGLGTLDWEITADCSWLEITPASGQSTGESHEVQLNVNISSLNAGVYNCELIIKSNSASNSPQKVDLTLFVMDKDGILSVPSEYPTIQLAIDVSDSDRGDTVIVADGIYKGEGNRDISFRGRSITVKSENGPEHCIIDCSGTENNPHRGFDFINHEDANSVLDGFTVTNGYASGNWPDGCGGGIRCYESDPKIINCILSKNFAVLEGGGISCECSKGPIIQNCLISSNTSSFAGGLNCWYSSPAVSKCTIVGNYGKYGAGVYCGRNKSNFSNCIIKDNISDGNSYDGSVDGGGGFYCYDCKLAIVDCIVSNNHAYSGEGGGILFWYAGDDGGLTIIRTIVSGNSADGGGGVLCNYADCSISNSIVSGNRAVYGGGLYFTSNPHLNIVNTTVVQNLASETGGGIYDYGSYNSNVINSIIWANYGSSCSESTKYSDVEYYAYDWGNIHADPCFVSLGYWVDRDNPTIPVELDDPNAIWIDGNYHLRKNSPCIDKGSPNYVAKPNETDLDGKPRVIDGRIDMGAYEFSPNTSPVACIMSVNEFIEAQGPFGAKVTLDGSCSSDADSTPGTNDDINAFNWYEVDPCNPDNEIYLGSGQVYNCNLPLGSHTIALEVTDKKAGATDSNEITIIVEDTTPPEFNLSVSPTILWPPNHKMVEITKTCVASDLCDPEPEVSLVNITTNEPCNPDDIKIAPDGSISLSATRSGNSKGRIYTITCQACDESVNCTTRSATVTIPHDNRK